VDAALESPVHEVRKQPVAHVAAVAGC
jgi:hypothetical protein